MTDEERAAQVVRLGLQVAYERFREREQELGRLDAAAGDGDHGAAMVRGLTAANKAVAASSATSVGALLQEAGAAFADAGGGASGALFGMCITTVGQRLAAGPYTPAAVLAAMQGGLDMVSAMGKAKPGDKTLIDTLDPFCTELAQQTVTHHSLTHAWKLALAAAEEGAAATSAMIAKRGRSARLGERSLGHRDPGAMSMLYLLQAFGRALDESCPD